MGVIREAGLVVGGIDRLEVVEEQEGVEMVELSSPDAAPEMNAGAFDDWLGRDDVLNTRGLREIMPLLERDQARPKASRSKARAA